MTILAQLMHEGESVNFTADQDYESGAVIQMSDGRAGVVTTDLVSGALGSCYVCGVFKIAKTTSMVLLKGGRAFWDSSASKVYFRPIDDVDFYLGRVLGDAAATDTTCTIALNDFVRYDVDFKKDPGISVPVGTAAAGAFGRGVGWKGGGVLNLNLTATSEAQKIDWLSKDGFNIINSNAIVEIAFSVPTGSAAGGTQDLSIGIATGTNATDADAITKHLFMHFDGNAVKLNFQSKDGTTTVTATDSTTTLTAGNTNAAGVRKYVWLDLRTPASVAVYVDGVQVLTGTTFDISAWSTTTAYLLAHLEKTTGTDTAEVDVDELMVRYAKI